MRRNAALDTWSASLRTNNPLAPVTLNVRSRTCMPNPPPIHLLPGSASAGPPIVGAQSLTVVVTANGVLPNGSNPGSVDTTTPLTITPLQNAAGQAVTVSIDPANNRRIICAPTVLSPPGGTGLPWSFRVSAAGRTTTLLVSGDTASPADVSGVGWDGTDPVPA